MVEDERTAALAESRDDDRLRDVAHDEPDYAEPPDERKQRIGDGPEDGGLEGVPF